MYLKIRGLNPNETYCCRKRDIIKYFGKEENIYINFGFSNRSRNEEINNAVYAKEAGTIGRVVASISIFNNSLSGYKNETFLTIFILNKKNIQASTIKKFTDNVLEEIYEKYKNAYNGSKLKESERGFFHLYVSLVGDEFIISEQYH